MRAGGWASGLAEAAGAGVGEGAIVLQRVAWVAGVVGRVRGSTDGE